MAAAPTTVVIGLAVFFGLGTASCPRRSGGEPLAAASIDDETGTSPAEQAKSVCLAGFPHMGFGVPKA